MKKQIKDSKERLFGLMKKINPDFKKRSLVESEVTKEIQFGEDNVISVMFFGKCEMIDTGIGSYEFGGSKGFHKEETAECENITWHMDEYTKEENMVIEKYFNDNYHEIKREMEEKYEEGGGDSAHEKF